MWTINTLHKEVTLSAGFRFFASAGPRRPAEDVRGPGVFLILGSLKNVVRANLALLAYLLFFVVVCLWLTGLLGWQKKTTTNKPFCMSHFLLQKRTPSAGLTVICFDY